MEQVDQNIRSDRPTSGDAAACKIVLDRLIQHDAGFRQRILEKEPQASALFGALNRIIAYAADDGQPVSETVHARLTALGLR
jgi:hypothetical protein